MNNGEHFDPVVVAIVDDGVDEHHPEFLGRIVPGYHASPMAVAARVGVGRVRPDHGTKVAGVVLAGGREVMGLAPHAQLMTVGLPSLSGVVGHPAEAEGLRWAADHGADIMCCAWAPPNPSEESGQLRPHTRAAIDYCLTRGRNGKGCILVFSAGN